MSSWHSLRRLGRSLAAHRASVYPVTGGAGAALLAQERREHRVVAVRTADAGEALVQVAALEEGLTLRSTNGITSDHADWGDAGFMTAR